MGIVKGCLSVFDKVNQLSLFRNCIVRLVFCPPLPSRAFLCLQQCLHNPLSELTLTSNVLIIQRCTQRHKQSLFLLDVPLLYVPRACRGPLSAALHVKLVLGNYLLCPCLLFRAETSRLAIWHLHLICGHSAICCSGSKTISEAI